MNPENVVLGLGLETHVLGLETQVLGLGFAPPSLGLAGLGLEVTGLVNNTAEWERECATFPWELIPIDW